MLKQLQSITESELLITLTQRMQRVKMHKYCKTTFWIRMDPSSIHSATFRHSYRRRQYHTSLPVTPFLTSGPRRYTSNDDYFRLLPPTLPPSPSPVTQLMRLQLTQLRLATSMVADDSRRKKIINRQRIDRHDLKSNINITIWTPPHGIIHHMT